MYLLGKPNRAYSTTLKDNRKRHGSKPLIIIGSYRQEPPHTKIRHASPTALYTLHTQSHTHTRSIDQFCSRIGAATEKENVKKTYGHARSNYPSLFPPSRSFVRLRHKIQPVRYVPSTLARTPLQTPHTRRTTVTVRATIQRYESPISSPAMVPPLSSL